MGFNEHSRVPLTAPEAEHGVAPAKLEVHDVEACTVAPKTGRTTSQKRLLAACGIALIYSLWTVSLRGLHARSWASQDDKWSESAAHPHRSGRWLSHEQIEKVFLGVPNEQSAILASRLFASKPHMAGTDGDLTTAKLFYTVLEKELGALPPAGFLPGEAPLLEAGSPESRDATLSITTESFGDAPRAWIDTYYPVMNTPMDRSLDILGDDGEAVWSANVEEVADFTDPEAGEHVTSVPAFHGLSGNGTAIGQLVYAGYGTKEEYDRLEAEGVNFTGKVVITRYGGIFRGLKVKGAEDRGAAGVLIYSDVNDDGTVTEKNGYTPYPNGPARNPTSVQRGSVQYLSVYPGDPTTPGYPAYQNSTRTNGDNIPTIPSLPISWANAQFLLREIEAGGANRTIKLVNHVDERVIKIWNTMGVIPGHIRDEVVVIGNHRDAWVMGAADPSSGTASVHEVLRGFGVLLKAGWRPLRTIVIASWDAEEYGLIGSTEWGEDFADWIDKHVVSYLNLDGSVSGSRFRASASPSLAHMVRQAAEKVPHPTKENKSLWDARNDHGTLYGNASSTSDVGQEVIDMFEMQHAAATDSVGVGPLGSGSDFTVFLQRIGIASSNGGFGATLQDPVYHYHSVYDSVRWQEIYADPGFFRHTAVAKFFGLQTLSLSDSIVLPLNTTHYALELSSYLAKVESIASTVSLEVDFAPLRQSIEELQLSSAKLDKEKVHAKWHLLKALKKWRRRHSKWRLRRKLRKAICKVRRKLGKPCHRRGKQDAELDITNFVPSWIWKEAGEGTCQTNIHKPGKHDKRIERELRQAAKRVKRANAKLAAFERGLISSDGIKDREWYRHLGVAPGKWLGYGATTLPALTEAITIDRNSTLAQIEARRMQTLIEDLAKVIHP
ncbi:Zn-dependent exopeptidase [Punctularia strigosozonata HHB-11173 SS5]|uniref:Zn-dependent exopeptidase n=1 Tax=Punctularia strigosozonata (strain HHB-11173) TaxID=741275 RepID=UPI0004416511|nr:Zn-dependent exopeptidase [Punctularia strigosozonata HHB-11173 SS5]EIN10538.1 Zn-dependent exopeptidase [Punctularia strigosozonata HHB-11173 SS5]